MEERVQCRRSIFNVLISGVPGARQFVALIFGVLGVFLLSVAVSGYLFMKALQIGNYAEVVLSEKFYLIVGAWAAIWLVSFAYAVRSSLLISYRVAGPMKRMERLLDDVLNGGDARISLRERDALAGIAQRINTLLEMGKSGTLQEQQERYANRLRKAERQRQEHQNL